MKLFTGIIAAAVLAPTLVGCASPEVNSSATAPPVIEHVHGITPDPGSDDVLIATHNGIFSVSQEGTVAGPVGGYDFDAMGFTGLGATLFASGHPGVETPSELGSPNLGIIRSDDSGKSWAPVSLTGIEDFHVLTTGPDGFLYGIGSSQPNLVISRDDGVNWEPQREISAIDLAVTGGGIYAATENGVQISTDQGATFRVLEGAPILYQVAAKASGGVIGVDVEGLLWSLPPGGEWEKGERVTGQVQALGVTSDDHPVFVDDRGIVEITPQGAQVLSPLVR
ncbi:F510_1955 family glycosylhydrolase [Glutamicibacter ardleyensis]|uniref:Exo-alpha-sialidase n=1 Tax=Glutamicibacter ardleyensis TaxID=225894 RepID=A0ABQ2DD52_9MICC|nr:hypothetical protein [Glutamicibacter ardleyensis]GGJ54032.1 hypothetical protein GCM10007173_10740 [Glutamicibacter ardleyensis]